MKLKNIKLSFRDKKSFSGIKFWLDPIGKLFSWRSQDFFSPPHHSDTIQEASKGKHNDPEEAQKSGWVSGGYYDKELYLRPYNFESAIENISHLPSEYRTPDRLTMDTEVDGHVELNCFGRDARFALRNYLRDRNN